MVGGGVRKAGRRGLRGFDYDCICLSQSITAVKYEISLRYIAKTHPSSRHIASFTKPKGY